MRQSPLCWVVGLFEVVPAQPYLMTIWRWASLRKQKRRDFQLIHKESKMEAEAEKEKEIGNKELRTNV